MEYVFDDIGFSWKGSQLKTFKSLELNLVPKLIKNLEKRKTC